MDLAHTSRYWNSYRASKTFDLTIYIYEAHLGFAHNSTSNMNINGNASSHGDPAAAAATGPGTGPWETKVVVRLPNDPLGERHETARAKKTPNPIWDQEVIFKDVDYSELVRVEVRGLRKIGENPVLGTLEFEVHDVMGLSLREEASIFQLECDRSRVRYGVILLAFHFDPPVAADVLGELDGVGSTVALPRGTGGMKKRSIHEDQDRGAAPMCEAPVYINVAGHFACLLLEDGVPLQPSCVAPTKRPPAAAKPSTGPLPSSVHSTAAPANSAASDTPSLPDAPALRTSWKRHTIPPRASSQPQGSGSTCLPPEASESLKSGSRMSWRKAMAMGGSNSGSGGRNANESKGRPRSLGENLAQQFNALSLTGLSRAMSAEAPLSRPASGGSTTRGGIGSAFDLRNSDNTQRWSISRLRNNKQQERSSSSFNRTGHAGSWRNGKRNGARGWTEGIMRSSSMRNLRTRARAPTALSGGFSRGKQRSRSRSSTRGDTDFSTESSSVGQSAATSGTTGDGGATSPVLGTALKAALAAAEKEEREQGGHDSRFKRGLFFRGDSECASLWQP